MSAPENKPKEEAKKIYVNVATQKTFVFSHSDSAEHIDKTVNKWLLLQAKSGAPAQLGKVHSTGWLFKRRIYMQYLYTTKALLNG